MANKTPLKLGSNGPTAFVSGDTIGAATGGTALDTSASTGIAQVASGTWSVAALTAAQIPSTLNATTFNTTGIVLGTAGIVDWGTGAGTGTVSGTHTETVNTSAGLVNNAISGKTNVLAVNGTAVITAAGALVTIAQQISLTGGINLNASDTASTINGLYGTSTGPVINAVSGKTVQTTVANTNVWVAAGTSLTAYQPIGFSGAGYTTQIPGYMLTQNQVTGPVSVGQFLNSSGSFSMMPQDTNGILTLVESLVDAVHFGPNSWATMHPSGNFMVFQSYSTGLSTMALNPSGIPTFLAITSCYNNAAMPQCFDGLGRWFYKVAYSASILYGWTFNETTGSLTVNSGISAGPISTNPTGICADPSGRYLYVASPGYVDAYSINQQTGVQAHIAQYTLTSTIPYGIICDPAGTYVYVAVDGASGGIQAYAITSSTGALTAVGSLISLPYAFRLAIDPFNRYLYVTVVGASHGSSPITSGSGSSIQAYSIAAGVLASIGNYVYGGQEICVDPTGRYVYSTSYSNSNLTCLIINQVTGALTQYGAQPTVPDAWLLAVHPSGMMVYSAGYYNSGTTLYCYSVGLAAAPDNLGYANSVTSTNNQIVGTSLGVVVNSVGGKSGRQATKNTLAASSNATVYSSLASTYCEIKIIDNAGNIVYYSLANGTLTQITTNTTYSVTSSPASGKIGLAYSGGTVTIYTGASTTYSWAAFIDITN